MFAMNVQKIRHAALKKKQEAEIIRRYYADPPESVSNIAQALDVPLEQVHEFLVKNPLKTLKPGMSKEELADAVFEYCKQQHSFYPHTHSIVRELSLLLPTKPQSVNAILAQALQKNTTWFELEQARIKAERRENVLPFFRKLAQEHTFLFKKRNVHCDFDRFDHFLGTADPELMATEALENPNSDRWAAPTFSFYTVHKNTGILCKQRYDL
jgi:hypothetical protein